ncbi:MAG: MFS transporter, partial [Firmicutes bacterium]|nr:MFS transporter [Bacillota bacterium]
LLGTGMTGVALTLWAWQATGSATALAVVSFCGFAPAVLFSPLAGALVDRWNRKLVMMLSDMAAAAVTVLVLVLLLAERLEVWHLCLAAAVAGTFQAFQFPAYSAAATLMVPKEHYGRASAMIGLAQSAAGVLAPVCAGALIGPVGVTGILVLDLVSVAVALSVLLVVRVPQPSRTPSATGRASLWKDAAFGFRYILARPSLLGLQLLFTAGNFLSTLAATLAAPMVLARTGNDALVLGTVQSAGAFGAVAGGVLLTTWGGFGRKVYGVMLGWAGSLVAANLALGLGRGPAVWAPGVFLAGIFGVLINTSNQAIWQRKVPPEFQGRVFSVRLLIAQVSGPLATLLAGPLADRVFEPAMRGGEGTLARLFGGLVGTGAGAGMALIMLGCALLGLVAVFGAYFVRSVREVETIVPDFDEARPVETAASPTADAAEQTAGPSTGV